MGTDYQLRAWAKGNYPTEAGTELPLRAFDGRFAGPGWAWMKEDSHGRWIDFESIPEHIGGLSGGEQRFLHLAASIGGAHPVILAEVIAGIDRKVLDLVLAAIAHAGGSHEDVELVIGDDGTGTYNHVDTLHPWPPQPGKAPSLRLVEGGA